MNDKLNGLIEIAKLLRDRDLAILALQQSQCDDLQRTREILIRQSEYEKEVAMSDLVYQRSCHDPRSTWMQGQIVDLTQKQARNAADLEAKRKVAARSFGRAEVMFKILAAQQDQNSTN